MKNLRVGFEFFGTEMDFEFEALNNIKRIYTEEINGFNNLNKENRVWLENFLYLNRKPKSEFFSSSLNLKWGYLTSEFPEIKSQKRKREADNNNSDYNYLKANHSLFMIFLHRLSY
jgi:hypothetical protein